MPVNSLFAAGTVDRVEVRGLQELQRELDHLLEQVDPGRGLLRDVTLATGMAHRYATAIVHVDTGRLKNSIFWEVSRSGDTVTGRVATNVSYAFAENNRGGSHAFFDRAVAEEGPAIRSLFNIDMGRG